MYDTFIKCVFIRQCWLFNNLSMNKFNSATSSHFPFTPWISVLREIHSKSIINRAFIRILVPFFAFWKFESLLLPQSSGDISKSTISSFLIIIMPSSSNWRRPISIMLSVIITSIFHIWMAYYVMLLSRTACSLIFVFVISWLH